MTLLKRKWDGGGQLALTNPCWLPFYHLISLWVLANWIFFPRIFPEIKDQIALSSESIFSPFKKIGTKVGLLWSSVFHEFFKIMTIFKNLSRMNFSRFSQPQTIYPIQTFFKPRLPKWKPMSQTQPTRVNLKLPGSHPATAPPMTPAAICGSPGLLLHLPLPVPAPEGGATWQTTIQRGGGGGLPTHTL